MGRSPCCSKEGLNRGAWTAIEDKILTDYIKAHGDGKWRSLPKAAGLKRCGKSCRLRWLNYLRPDIKRGNLTQDEQDLIIRLHRLLGNRWSLIAGRLPGRTDNEVKNYWNTKLSKNTQPKESKFDKKSTTTRSPCNDHDDQAPTKVFRTKAIRLMSHQVRQVMINNTQQQQRQRQDDPDQNHFHDSNCNSTVESESTGGSSSSFSFLSKEENSSEYVTGFDIGGISFSEIFDFNDFCDVNNVIKGDIIGNPDESNTDLLLNEELMLENWNGGDGCDVQVNMDSNFGSSASFLESGQDWLI